MAALSFACYVLTSGAIYYLLIGLLIANLAEGIRRSRGVRLCRDRRPGPRAPCSCLAWGRCEPRVVRRPG